MAKALGQAGRPAIAITKDLLKKLKKFSSSGISQSGIAAAIRMSLDTFSRRLNDNADFAAAFKDGRSIYWQEIADVAPRMRAALVKAGLEGSVAAQLGFIEKVQGRIHANEENIGHVSIEELGETVSQAQGGGPLEIQEVRIRRIKHSGRIEDDFG